MRVLPEIAVVRLGGDFRDVVVLRSEVRDLRDPGDLGDEGRMGVQPNRPLPVPPSRGASAARENPPQTDDSTCRPRWNRSRIPCPESRRRRPS